MDRSSATKYPILMLHGVGFRDLKWPLYWGRIPAALSAMGAELFYGQQDCWARVEENAKTVKARIRQILDETGAEKVNIIAHSKGGLEARMAASSLGMGPAIASITTIGTPHRGSKTVDRLLKAPDSLFNVASFAVNNWIGLIGDTKPDFYAVCRDFSTDYTRRLLPELCRRDENAPFRHQPLHRKSCGQDDRGGKRRPCHSGIRPLGRALHPAHGLREPGRLPLR